MPILQLTKRNVDALASKEKSFIAYDEELKGFGVRVTPNGGKSWIVEYRPGEGGRTAAKKRMTLGTTKTITTQQARCKAKEILAKARMGGDPAAERSRRRQTPKFFEFIDRYLTEEAELKLKPSTISNYRNYLHNHAARYLGPQKINEISRADVSRLHRMIGHKTPTTANRVLEVVSSVYRYASIMGEVDDGFNPTSGIRHFKEARRERYLSSDELAMLGATLRQAETVGLPWTVDYDNPHAKHLPQPDAQFITFSPYAVAAIRLLLFTGCRLGEILRLKWKYIDFDRGLLLLPDSKTGRRTVVLNAPALAILEGLERISDFVIAGDKADKPRTDLKRPWGRVKRHAKLTDLRIHDLRHSFASVGAGSGMGLPIVGKLLGHTTPATTARYAHLDNDPLKKASQEIGEKIELALNG